MARDRQRAKQRRRRQHGGAGPTGPARTRPRQDAVEPEPQVEPERQVEPEPQAEPQNTVFPTRRTIDPVETDEPVEPAPDELEDPAETYEPDPAVLEERAERAQARAGRKPRGRIITFLGHVIDELRRVQWPDRQHVAQGTAVVLGFVVIAGSYLGLLDAIWKPLIQAIL